MTKNKCLSLLMGASVFMTAVPALANNGVEAIQLDYVGVDSSVRCNRTFFRSSQHFKNTIFVVPRVEPGGANSQSVCTQLGPEGKKAYDISPTENPDEFFLFARVYFPPMGERTNSGASQYVRDEDACNMDLVKESINAHLPKNEHVKTIARMPLTSIEVSIPGIKAIGRVGRSEDATEEADIINYYGTTLTAMFKITDQERRYFLSEVLKTDGVTAYVTMRFMAKHRDGSVRASVDRENLAAEFQAAAAGQLKMTRLEASARFKGLKFSNSIKITSEASKNGNLERVESMVLEQMTRELAELPEAVGSTPQPADPGSGIVTVKAVADMIASKIKKEVEFNQIAAPEVATALSKISYRSKFIEDPNITQIELKAGYSDPSSPYFVQKGGSFSIVPAYSFIEDLTYPETKYYLTKSEMTELGVYRRFPRSIGSRYMSIENDNRNGFPSAVGSYKRGVKWPPVLPLLNTQLEWTYRWERVQSFVQRTCLNSSFKRFKPKELDLASIPVNVSFSGLGDRQMFTLEELSQSNEFWESSFDRRTGRIRVKPLVNLGIIHFREDMKEGVDVVYDKEHPADLDYVTEEVTDPLGMVSRSDKKMLKIDKDPIMKQRTIVLNLVRENDSGEVLPPPAVPIVDQSQTLQQNQLAEPISLPQAPY